MVATVRERSMVLPVGVDLRRIGSRTARLDVPPLILWNQRWEHDKGPDEFVSLIEALVAEDLEFDVAVVGEQFISAPDSFHRLPELLGDRLVAFGFAPDEEYVDLLSRADIVVSTADHEFFGIAIVEAMAAGAFPVLPNRLVYPERLAGAHHDRCLYDNTESLVSGVRWALENRAAAIEIGNDLAATVEKYDWTEVAPAYDAVMQSLVTG
jgi:glycosyltransferase involved in cell wall biosynthesis